MIAYQAIQSSYPVYNPFLECDPTPHTPHLGCLMTNSLQSMFKSYEDLLPLCPANGQYSRTSKSNGSICEYQPTITTRPSVRERDSRKKMRKRQEKENEMSTQGEGIQQRKMQSRGLGREGDSQHPPLLPLSQL